MNHGVAALGNATALALTERLGMGRVTLFDHSRRHESATENGIGRCGAKLSRRLWDAYSWPRIRLATRAPLVVSPAAELLANASVIGDISGGDSFTDLYGRWRYKSISQPKKFAVWRRIPLILLPQTYGPFQDATIQDDAACLCRYATMAWARDARSFEVLKELLGDAFDPSRHRLGVDVAFLLPEREPAEGALPEGLKGAVTHGLPLIGVNISGLIYNDPTAARERYGFRADYREVALEFVRWLLERDEGDVVLIPHVLAPPGKAESDPQANEAIARELAPIAGGRLHVVPPTLDECETKWMIARCSWFCGTRMHATIAGLSSGVSTATISYSDKALGVFESCGVGDAVVDPRKLDTDAALEAIQDIYTRRGTFMNKLAKALPGVLRTAEWQMDEIARAITELAPGDARPRNASARTRWA